MLFYAFLLNSNPVQTTIKIRQSAIVPDFLKKFNQSIDLILRCGYTRNISGIFSKKGTS
jgi:hypothetical protein